MLNAGYGRRHSVLICLPGLIVLTICSAAAACTVDLDITKDYVPKGSKDDAVRMDICVSGIAAGKVKVKPSHSGANTGRIIIWNTARTVKLSENEAEFEIDVAGTQFPLHLWVQGVATSSAVPDVTVTAKLYDAENNLKDTHDDTVTVFDLTLRRCYGWSTEDGMPRGGTEDNTVRVQLSVDPFQFVPVTVRFILYDVSDEPGYCMNKPTTTPTPGQGEDSDAWKDLQFEDQTHWTITGANRDVATRVIQMSVTSMLVTCYDYGAYGKIKAQINVNDTWYTGHLVVGPQKYAKIPRDDDDNHVSDDWEHNDDGGAADDLDVSLNNTHHGDGLSLYEEYRGVDIDDNGIISASERLDPMLKDLFVQGTGFGGGFPDFGFGAAFSEAEITVHEFVGTVGTDTDDKNIDVLVVTVQDQGDHIQRLDPVGGSRYWIPDTLGDSGVGDETDYEGPHIYKRAHNYYFSDKPHVDGNTWSGVGQWNNPPNGELDPLAKVEDANDNGVLDALPGHNERDGAVTPPPDDGDGDFDGDYPKKVGGVWTFNNDLNPCDIDDDGKVEIFEGEYTKTQVVDHCVTHEMGHAVGIYGAVEGHCNDETCVMYKWNHAVTDHFCNDCRAMILIHNK